MSNDLLAAAFLAWLAAAAHCAHRARRCIGRALLFFGSAPGIAAAVLALPNGTPAVLLPTQVAGAAVSFQISSGRVLAAGLRIGAGGARLCAGDAGTAGPERLAIRRRHEPHRRARRLRSRRRRGFLIAWEIMSFGGAVMILSERLSSDFRPARPVHARPSRNRRARAGHRGTAARGQPPNRSPSLRSPQPQPVFAVPAARCHRLCFSSSASAPNSACCRSTSGSRAPTAPAAARPAP